MSRAPSSDASPRTRSTIAGCARSSRRSSRPPCARATTCRQRATSTCRRGRRSPVRSPSRPARLPLPFVLALAFAGNATAGAIVDRAATALQSNPVYVDPSAEKTITAAQAERLRTEIETTGHGPIYIGVLPNAALSEAGGDAVGVADELARQLGNPGVYAVVAGGHFRSLSTDLGRGKAGKLAAQSFDAHHDDGIAATLSDFVDRVGAERSGKGDGRSFGSIGLFPILLIGGILFFGYRKLKQR